MRPVQINPKKGGSYSKKRRALVPLSHESQVAPEPPVERLAQVGAAALRQARCVESIGLGWDGGVESMKNPGPRCV